MAKKGFAGQLGIVGLQCQVAKPPSTKLSLITAMGQTHEKVLKYVLIHKNILYDVL